MVVNQSASHLGFSDHELRNWPLSKLRELHFEMGKQCNVRCIMCYQTDFSPATRMVDEMWKEKLRPAYEAAKVLTVSGGEPTIMPSCRELLKMIMSDYAHLKLNMVTNGVQLRGVFEEAFLKQGNVLNVSLNAIKPELYAKIVQFGRQSEVIANIQRLIEKRNESGSALKIRVSTVIINDTVHEMADFIQWAADNGLDEVLLYQDYLQGVTRYDVATVRQFIADAYAASDLNPHLRMLHLDDWDWYYAKLHGLEPVRPRPIFQKPTEPCGVAFDSMIVSHDGAVKPCCKSWYLFGNLLKSSLIEVWQSDAANTFRKRMLGLDFRDCLVACDLNANPINPRLANARKAYWVIKRDPKEAVKKAKRRLGFSSAQIDDLPQQPQPKISLQSTLSRDDVVKE